MKARLLLGGYLLFSAFVVQASERWFEIEMIIFERAPDSQLQEQFPEQVTPIRLGRNIDLVTPKFAPSIAALLPSLTLCYDNAALNQSIANASQAWQAGFKLFCHQETQPLAWQRKSIFPEFLLNTIVPLPNRIAPQLSGSGMFKGVPYLAESTAFGLTEVAERLRRQRQHQVLLHTVWRQAPVTERRAIPSRWFAGENFTERFDYWGQPNEQSSPTTNPINNSATALTEINSVDVLEQIASRRAQLAAGVTLDQPTTAANETNANQNQVNLPNDVWQLDGLFKLHLDHYLFVNTDFNLRRLVGESLHSINVKQSRRVISGEIHYLDHPHLGIILQIRRFTPPAPEVVENSLATLAPSPIQ
ncbi:CsiV family protein [Alishewanella sp. d11]|uniref:CsiV family protein n=1 Tax=Alishewanella sp. d11 TaxID=3414030 RepID=UPI003BF7A1E8